ncbi:hypothetical protein I302_104552 [Kwoniella bestiolae CBS 10118]|uniref:Uncharacterized protein n=1 Tax=Kwoniella bestiolae CBS 10118 TaxID=1296100 RepID=A0A1B9GBK3_9TREE|nr:hypothetical protein I302_03257 [Kwoniella bestiolae CBS 10118]OCF28398.1 hypothetical protein I302_03257 [Kwoniella bestiolae CBS 10118]
MDLGRPIGESVPSRGFDQGEHGAGTGLSGGYGEANASNTQAGQYAQNEQSGFNAGVGGNHASGGIPSGTPIADKFTSGSSNTPNVYGSTGSHSHHGTHGATGATGAGTGVGAKLDNALDQYSGSGAGSGLTGSHSHGTHGTHGGDAVSGAYEGSGTRDGLTGQSGAHTTGSGVGVGGENLSGGHHGARDAALAGTAAGAGALAGKEFSSSHHGTGTGAESTAPPDRGSGLAGVGGGLQPGIGGETGSGVGPSGGSGGHYTTGDSSKSGALGAGALGAGAGAAGASGLSGSRSDAQSGVHSTGGPESSSTRAGVASNPTAGSGGAGKYGRAEAHDGQGEPISNPKDLDTGNAHSLVLDKATGQYVHRRDLEGGAAHKH